MSIYILIIIYISIHNAYINRKYIEKHMKIQKMIKKLDKKHKKKTYKTRKYIKKLIILIKTFQNHKFRGIYSVAMRDVHDGFRLQ